MRASRPSSGAAAVPKSDRAVLSNAEIADRLSALAQLLTVEKANPYKVRAYQRAAATIRGMGESVDELVRGNADMTVYAGIGEAIAAAIREIVETGTLASLDKLRQNASPELVDISAHPRLDPQRILRIYRKLGIGSIGELRSALDSGQIERSFGVRMAHHVRQGLVDAQTILLYHAHPLVGSIEKYLTASCKVTRAEAVGDYRRRVEVISELDVAVQAENFAQTVSCFERFGGRTPLVESNEDTATLSLHAGPLLRLHRAEKRDWGLALVRLTGSKAHLRKLTAITGSLRSLEKGGRAFVSELALYRKFGLEFIPPELRDGLDEVKLAREKKLPVLITEEDIRGDLHAHTEASDGVDSIEEMAVAAREFGYEYVGISDHSPSLKIAHGLEPERLWDNIRTIDKLNDRLKGVRILKSAEVDILADGSLDYSDDMLRELDYTVCSIHSRFAMNRQQQTERVLRAMDNRYFSILGHATGRLLLKRPGYELDMERIIEKAKENGKFFELNCSPDRLDVSAENARLVKDAGILLSINTDSHSTPEYRTIRYGVEQARRAGVEKKDVLNCLPLEKLLKLFRR